MNPASYDTARHIAQAGGEAERVALACLPDAAPEILYFLAGAPEVMVRAAVAANVATPAQADRLLAADAEPRVRAVLGRKLAQLAPALAAAQQDRLRQLAWSTLCDLAADTAVMVRAVIAEELQAMPDAPRELILRLASDAAMEVAEPVIRFSPQLTEADLLALVAAPPVPETVAAVARRPRLSEALSDAIVAAADPGIVGLLLENPSAAIRESTLDALIANAAAHTAWQESLVRRPCLPPHAARNLAVCIADHLLGALAARPDLDPGLAQALRQRVAQRLAVPSTGNPAALPARGAPLMPPEQAFEDAGLRGDREGMTRLLAEAAGLPASLVEQAIRLRSAKGLVSLCWKAGFSPRCAMLAQTALGHLAPGNALGAAEHGGWPLSPEEMRWQIELLAERED
ncbi:DUF2336 domain-containing protein [Siccirubricoccus sp. G192]|uniref:DUF2336 domain-containing protein n=1 Tax=Siccirubricoccus sp. G192 TaxID=2849651 RepID=UPI001C2C94DD|nr:DUF2336 domain-containing protein [Siccirubricoccus sp. G192]MBV1799052.1 DUF2336 domain-containing protein [Siccirubricoccus sp. G192]